MKSSSTENIEKLIKTVERLRAPNGCPWDREQTHKSLKENFLQEVYETLDAIDSNNYEDLKEELGDVLLQIVLHAQMANEVEAFDFDDVAKIINEKLIRRHPHVFSDVKVNNVAEVMSNWDKIKQKEKPHRISYISGITKSQPALMSALQISKKAVKAGFEWPDYNSLKNCITSEFKEFDEALEHNDKEHMEEEFGDILFAMVNMARWNKIDPELALMKANNKFISRFHKMEEITKKDLKECSYEELDNLWNEAKKLTVNKVGLSND
ncbi:MAG: nucleoside triphosphate pyrophosphohydrolase [bacterium]